MSHPVGMLRFKEKGGKTRGVEASMVKDFEHLSPPGFGGTLTRINLKDGGEFFAFDAIGDLMDQYDHIVYARQPRSESK